MSDAVTPTVAPLARPSRVGRRHVVDPIPPAAVNSADSTQDIGVAIALLRDAESARVGGDPQAALAALDRYVRRFPSDPLRRERARLERRAACSNGDTVRARSALDVLVAIGVESSNAKVCP